ncbi:unnamed protein product [Rotaria sp. Silwood1]|nr:unnamed protein product [Rotaria sp. Silwood1]CAF1684511.1 unnamed protein product [Rotaria sp. Silwood1]
MVKRTWNFVDKFSSEDELLSYIVQNTVSIKRTEEIEAGKKVIYRCSKYRKYPECDFQVKVIFSHDDGVTVSTSNEHDHAHQYATFPWKKFEDFSKWFYAGRLVTLPMMCSCKTNLKTYVCKHAVGISIHFGLYIISDPNKLESLGKRRGRPKKAGPALSR